MNSVTSMVMAYIVCGAVLFCVSLWRARADAPTVFGVIIGRAGKVVAVLSTIFFFIMWLAIWPYMVYKSTFGRS